MAEGQPIVLTIAGVDPSSGAGVTADIKTIAAHGCFGVSAITAMTVQSTQGVAKVEALKPSLITATLETLTNDLDIDAVHIGMLANAEMAQAVATFLAKAKLPNLVLDPILKSSSGADLLDKPGRAVLIDKLFPLAAIITPNAAEASVLTGLPVTTPEQMEVAADKLHTMGAKAVVVTGGDLEKAIDVLSFPGKKRFEREVFKAERQKSKSTHGTGCAFSTAIACHLAHKRGLPEAVFLAKAYVSAAIANGIPMGKGTGPVNHLYRMNETRRTGSANITQEHHEP
jgi:hydroxymethylpyrimidine/phosphomethylpyrimidine kinase